MARYIHGSKIEGNAEDELAWRRVLNEREINLTIETAFSELLDNSTAAYSKDGSISIKNIHMLFEPKTEGKKIRLGRAVFVDDGCGMDNKSLQECLIFGESSRYNDRTGIGRFGVGMSQCAVFASRFAAVYSKQKGGEWNYVEFDFTGEEFKDPAPQITDVEAKRPPKDILDKIGDLEHGTIVILKSFDRAHEPFDKFVKKFKHYVGRSYRHFIWGSINKFDNIKNNISMYLNGEEIPAFDPLYVTKVKTDFPDDLPAEEYPFADIPVETDEENSSTETNVQIRMSLLPKEWRQRKGQNRTKEDKEFEAERHVGDNKCISILRKGREVGWFIPPHDWPWPSIGHDNNSWNMPINRWWSCEISFDPSCDQQFRVTRNKNGVMPLADLRDVLAPVLTFAIKTMTEKIHNDWDEYIKNNKKDKDNEDEKPPTAVDEIINEDPVVPNDQHNPEKPEIPEKYRAKDFQIELEAWPDLSGAEFAQYMHGSRSLTLRYNTNHTLHKKISSLEKIITDENSSKADLINAAENFNSIIQIIVWSYGKAQSNYQYDQKLTTEDLFESYNPSVGRLISNYITKLNRREEKGDDEE